MCCSFYIVLSHSGCLYRFAVLVAVLLLFRVVVFFFFKRKTAYEMRISDWSSDVCSSDLAEKMARIPIKIEATTAPLRKPTWIRAKSQGTPEVARIKDILRTAKLHTVCEEAACPNLGECFSKGTATFMRSEEHTSELQSLMRISYADFCLKKKNIKNK